MPAQVCCFHDYNRHLPFQLPVCNKTNYNQENNTNLHLHNVLHWLRKCLSRREKTKYTWQGEKKGGNTLHIAAKTYINKRRSNTTKIESTACIRGKKIQTTNYKTMENKYLQSSS